MKELILGLRGWSFGPESERTDYGPDRAYLGPDRADLRPEMKPGGRTDAFWLSPKAEFALRPGPVFTLFFHCHIFFLLPFMTNFL